MSKRKPARRKTTTKPATLTAKPLRALGATALRRVPRTASILFTPEGIRKRTEFEGVPLPPDLEVAVGYYAGLILCDAATELETPPWDKVPYYHPEPIRSEEDYPGWKEPVLSHLDWQIIREGLEQAFRQGFYLALLRYAADLKSSAEAGLVLERLRHNATKGGAARRKKAEPTHRAIRKRFRELRKESPKKTARYLRVAEEFGISDRHVARIVDGLD